MIKTYQPLTVPLPISLTFFDERWINRRFSTSYKRLEYSLGMTPVFWLKDCSPSVEGLALFVN